VVQEKPYFCPNCRSNRTKFRLLTTMSQHFRKDPITGAVTEMREPVPVEQNEPTVGCEVCGFVGNELRFVKQAEREPRLATPTEVVYR